MKTTKILIIGTGFGGLCMGAKLLEAGINDFIIVEKAQSIGGTWRENTYPGAECDIPSALYSFSFAQNPTWDFKWAKQKQILEYLEGFTTKFGLRDHIQFETCVESAIFDDVKGRWRVTTDKGDFECQFFISAIGQLHHPKMPNFEGMREFEGPTFHSAEWDHDIDLNGKRVGVIGTGASALQFIPEIAKKVSSLTVYQRSPNWVVDKMDRPYTRFEKGLAKFVPGLSNFYRAYIWAQGEYVIYPIIKGAKKRAALARWKSGRDMKKHIKDPEMQAALTPDYPIGAKRILFSDTFYEALASDNVELVTTPIDSFNSQGIIAKNRTLRCHDVVICGTGFYSNPFLKAIKVTGANGRDLHNHWKEGAKAYLGVSVAGFPNMFLIYGPNTNTGHTSVVYKIEAQVGHVLDLIDRTGEETITVTPEAETEFDAEMQSRLEDLAWAKVEESWYKVGERIPNNWPGSAREYKKRLSDPNWDHFIKA